jgi:hypothetical protein
MYSCNLKCGLWDNVIKLTLKSVMITCFNGNSAATENQYKNDISILNSWRVYPFILINIVSGIFFRGGGDKIHPWGTTSPLVSKFAPRGEVKAFIYLLSTLILILLALRCRKCYGVLHTKVLSAYVLRSTVHTYICSAKMSLLFKNTYAKILCTCMYIRYSI